MRTNKGHPHGGAAVFRAAASQAWSEGAPRAFESPSCEELIPITATPLSHHAKHEHNFEASLPQLERVIPSVSLKQFLLDALTDIKETLESVIPWSAFLEHEPAASNAKTRQPQAHETLKHQTDQQA